MNIQLASIILQQTLLYAHLIIFAFALVIILREDLHLFKSRYIDINRLSSTANTVTALLMLLLLTGIVLLAINPGLDIDLILSNAKLTAKLTVVSVLTVNGLMLHLFVLPSFNGQSPNSRVGTIALLASIFGSISTVSWLFAGFVGSARIISSVMNYQSFIYAYAAIATLGIISSIAIVRPRVLKLLIANEYRILGRRLVVNFA